MEDKKLYTTIPEEVVKKLFTSVTPVTITYAKKDMFDYLCYIKEFTGYNCPYWATLDFEEAFFRKEDIKSEANGTLFFKEPIKAYILQYGNFGNPVEVKIWKESELEKELIPTVFLSRLPYALDNGTGIFPKEYSAFYFDEEAKKEEERRGFTYPDGLVGAPHPKTLDIDIETFCKSYNLFRYPEAYRKMIYDVVQNLKLRPLKYEDNKILNSIFYYSGEPINYHQQPSTLSEIKVVPIKRGTDITEENILGAISSGYEDYI